MNSSSFVAEVGVHHGLGDVGEVGDLLHGGRVVAAAGEDLHGHVQHLLFADHP